MVAYFNLNNNEISKEHLVNKFNMILGNPGRLMLNDQNIPLPNEDLRDLLGLFRSSHRRCSVKKDFLKKFANFTGKHLYCSLQLY